MNAKRQYGQGLSSFMLGLILATIIIGAIVYLLNRSASSDFKEPTETKELPVPTEILQPKNTTASVPPAEVTASALDLPDISDDIDNPNKHTAPSDTPDVSDDPKPVVPTVVPPVINTPPKSQLNESKPSERPKPPVVKHTPKVEEPVRIAKPPKATPKDDSKPTPEQILEHGNIEKAREQAKREAIEQERERRKAEAALSGKAHQSNSTNNTSNKSSTVVQAGSYGNREAAEEQRAKLAMMGVKANIVDAEVKGKTMYRVQTAPSSRENANQTRQTLQQNGVDSFVRSE